MSADVPRRLALDVRLFTHTQPIGDGLWLLASFDAPQLNMTGIGLMLDMHKGELRLQAPCGCDVSQSFSALMLRLAEVLREGHPEAAPPPLTSITNAVH